MTSDQLDAMTALLPGGLREFHTSPLSLARQNFAERASLSIAAFRELYCRTSNPARPYMLWLSEVREARRLFRTFKARMAQLVQEVNLPPLEARALALSPV